MGMYKSDQEYFLHRSNYCCPAPPKCLADPASIDRALNALRQARNPLVIIGKGKT